MHNISVTSTMVKKIITNLDSSKASGPDCIPLVVLKNCEPELSYILAEPFKMCLKESFFPDCWKVSLVVLVFKNVAEMSTAKNYPVSLLSVVSKVLVKWFVNDLPDVICNIAIYADDTTLYSKWSRHLICGNNYNWLLNLNLICDTLWNGAGSGLLISKLEK